MIPSVTNDVIVDIPIIKTRSKKNTQKKVDRVEIGSPRDMYFERSQREKSRRLLTPSLESRYASYPYHTFKLLLRNETRGYRLLFLSGHTSTCIFSICFRLRTCINTCYPSTAGLTPHVSPNDNSDDIISYHSDDISYHMTETLYHIKISLKIIDISLRALSSLDTHPNGRGNVVLLLKGFPLPLPLPAHISFLASSSANLCLFSHNTHF